VWLLVMLLVLVLLVLVVVLLVVVLLLLLLVVVVLVLVRVLQPALHCRDGWNDDYSGLIVAICIVYTMRHSTGEFPI
jgi:hypothetical protein